MAFQVLSRYISHLVFYSLINSYSESIINKAFKGNYLTNSIRNLILAIVLESRSLIVLNGTQFEYV